MGVQEISTFLIVAAAAAFTARRFIRQFTHGDEPDGKCAKCGLNQAALQKKATKPGKRWLRR
ncbi:MAG: hypothetical protein D6743_08045 [Calditrichaeota bacterium]|nr:MAG: hypothetical protein D6743_08045 [Calditrichota bacterium]